MKTLIMLLVFGIGVSVSAQVNTPQRNNQKTEKMTPEQRQAKHLAYLTKELNLDSKQQEVVSKILADKNVKAQDLKTQKETRKANGTKMSADEKIALKNSKLAEKANTENQMKAILTADQYAKWETIRADNKAKRNAKSKDKM